MKRYWPLIPLFASAVIAIAVIWCPIFQMTEANLDPASQVPEEEVLPTPAPEPRVHLTDPVLEYTGPALEFSSSTDATYITLGSTDGLESWTLHAGDLRVTAGKTAFIIRTKSGEATIDATTGEVTYSGDIDEAEATRSFYRAVGILVKQGAPTLDVLR